MISKRLEHQQTDQSFAIKIEFKKIMMILLRDDSRFYIR
jgi:hypothetical protein